ncbi:unnamed protein product [Moneuplotes crassus]|uniref:Uncharacterized protein n=1 Tax=Euplotes crassus TaxID=5936 RepID=A0AAD1UK49_EUPCR|nr:unnamed protein product [Moneuplotes crassus]
MIVKVKLDQALTYQQWLDDKETPFVFTMLEPLAFCYKKKRKDRSSRDQNSPKDEFYETKDALRGINLADFKINCYFKYPEHMSKFKYNLMSNLPEKKRDQKSLSKQTDSELAGSQEIYCAAKIYSNSFHDQDSPDSSAKIYITLQNSKIAGLKQLHFSDPETKTAQYTRLGMLEGIGSVIPLHRPPMVTYLTNCSWLAPPEVVKFPQNALKRIRGIQNLDFEEETGKNSEIPENQEPAKPKSKPAPKPEIDYNKYEF